MGTRSGRDAAPITLKPSAVLTGVCIWLFLLSALLLFLSRGLSVERVWDALILVLLTAAFLAAGSGAVWSLRYRVVFESGRVTVRKFFSEKSYAYRELNAVIRRGRHSPGVRPKSADISKTMVMLYQGKRAVVALDMMLGPADRLFQAIQMIRSLDIPKKYL